MSLLDSDQVNAIKTSLGDPTGQAPPSGTVTAPTTESAPATPPSAPTAAPESPTSSGSSADVKQPETSSTSESPSLRQPASDSASDQKTSSGQKVPYGRFKNVLEARNAYKGQLDRSKAQISAREQRIADLERQLSSPSQRPAPAPTQPVPQAAKQSQDSTWLDDILGISETEQPAEPDKIAELSKGFQQELQKQQQSFESRMYEYEVNQAQRELEKEIHTVRRQYPDLKAKDLAQLVINDPSVNLMEAAETYMTYKVSLEEEAIARYLRDNPHLTQQQKQAVVEAAAEVAAEAAPTAPPRTSDSRAATAGAETVVQPAPRTMKDVKHALREHFKQNNPFAQ